MVKKALSLLWLEKVLKTTTMLRQKKKGNTKGKMHFDHTIVLKNVKTRRKIERQKIKNQYAIGWKIKIIACNFDNPWDLPVAPFAPFKHT